MNRKDISINKAIDTDQLVALLGIFLSTYILVSANSHSDRSM